MNRKNENRSIWGGMSEVRSQVKALREGLKLAGDVLAGALAPTALNGELASKLAEWSEERKVGSGADVARAFLDALDVCEPVFANAPVRQATLSAVRVEEGYLVCLAAGFDDGSALRATWQCPWDELPRALRDAAIRFPEQPLFPVLVTPDMVS